MNEVFVSGDEIWNFIMEEGLECYESLLKSNNIKSDREIKCVSIIIPFPKKLLDKIKEKAK